MKKLALYLFTALSFSSCGIIMYNGDIYRPVRLVKVNSVVDSSRYRNSTFIKDLTASSNTKLNSESFNLSEIPIDTLKAKIEREELYYNGQLIYPSEKIEQFKPSLRELKKGSAFSYLNDDFNNSASDNSLSPRKNNKQYLSSKNGKVLGYVKYDKNKASRTDPAIVILAVIGVVILIVLIAVLIFLTSFEPIVLGP